MHVDHLGPAAPRLDYAERASVVDLISGGRCELGLGVGYRIPEFAAHGTGISRRFALFENA